MADVISEDSMGRLYRDMMEYAYALQDGKKQFLADDLVSAMELFGERMALLVYMAGKYGDKQGGIECPPEN